ncbi:MAG TPA: hypothetical protein VM101_13070 [Flavitalea sp.]|nr:hypothetical protein [Flavitalea sp.]
MKQKLLFFVAIAIFSATHAFSQGNWPKYIVASDGGKLTMYEPQPESLNGNQLMGRAAVSVRKTETDEPVFGVVFFSATVQNSGSADNQITSMRITQAKFSGMEDQGLVDKYSSLLEKNSSGWNLGMSDNQMREAVDREKNTSKSADFNNAAPGIIYTNRPSTLIVLDGEPKVTYDKHIEADKVVNSPNLIFKEGNQWNLYAGGNWYTSSSITGNWTVNSHHSSKVKKVNEAVKKQEKENNKGQELTTTPKVTEIIVATQPTELLQSEGEPEYKAVSGTSLLYVANSPNEIFKDISTQKNYILIAGRWYNAQSMKGPWTYVSSDKLPEDFANIPEGSDKDRVLSNVAGTEAAEDARIEAAVPQTARVDKRTATIKVQYDGTPVFNRIEGTSLELAENANVTVMIDADGRYFALDNGIWFNGKSAYGPWSVANDRPRDVDEIPASSPAYNSKYVYVYDNTPDYVYMGYTGGYLGSYYYGPTVVYGTGWHYRPWYRSVYYPRPITWGFGFMYDPWIGWNINPGFNFGYLNIGFDYGGYGYGGYGYGYGGGWFGPQYYCPPYRRQHYGGYYGRYNDYYGYNGYNNQYNNYYGDGYGYNSRANGDGSRPNRGSNGVAPNNNPGNGGGSGWNRNYNLYNNQRGVVTQNINRSSRVYRPDGLTSNNNVTAPANGRYNNRLNNENNNNRTPVIRNNGSNNSQIENNRNNNRTYNPRQPQVNVPDDSRGIERNRNIQQEQNPGRERPVITRPEPVIGNNERPEPIIRRNERPQVERPVERPQVERPQVERPERVQRSLPEARAERNYRVEQPQRQQPQFERPSAPRQQQVERPTYSRPSAPHGGGSGGGIHENRGGRPAR